jgi:hypothetical protein
MPPESPLEDIILPDGPTVEPDPPAPKPPAGPPPTPVELEAALLVSLAMPHAVPSGPSRITQGALDVYAPGLKEEHHDALTRLVNQGSVTLPDGGRPNVPDRRMDGGSQ